MNKKKKYSLYIDMDDVMNFLTKDMIKKYNIAYNQTYDWLKSTHFYMGENKELLADNTFFINMLQEKGMFFDSEATEGLVECVKSLIDEGFEVYILTHPQWESDYCMNEKVDWVKKHLPFFDLEKMIMTKQKGLISAPNRILLDDNPANLEAWRSGGGISVSFRRAAYTKKWDGLYVESFEAFQRVVQAIENERSE